MRPSASLRDRASVRAGQQHGLLHDHRRHACVSARGGEDRACTSAGHGTHASVSDSSPPSRSGVECGLNHDMGTWRADNPVLRCARGAQAVCGPSRASLQELRRTRSAGEASDVCHVGAARALDASSRAPHTGEALESPAASSVANPQGRGTMGVMDASSGPMALLDVKTWMPFATFTEAERMAEAALAAKTLVAEARWRKRRGFARAPGVFSPKP